MPRRLPLVGHEQQLSIVEHLDELRSRIVVSLVAFGVAFALCVWQSHVVLDLLNAPLPNGQEPITLSPSEPFVTTLKNAGYASLLLSLPVLLYQAYAFLLPALAPRERRKALPLLLMAPALFLAGAAFCYLVVLAPALDFLLSFNASEFNTQLRASDYYDFATLMMLAMGLGFQVPVGLVAITRLGIVSVDQLRRSRRYAIVAIAVLAALLPTLDPFTLMLEMVPLIALYELGIRMSQLFARASEAAELSPPSDTPGARA